MARILRLPGRPPAHGAEGRGISSLHREDVSLRSANEEEVSLSILRHFRLLQFLCALHFRGKGDLHTSTALAANLKWPAEEGRCANACLRAEAATTSSRQKRRPNRCSKPAKSKANPLLAWAGHNPLRLCWWPGLLGGGKTFPACAAGPVCSQERFVAQMVQGDVAKIRRPQCCRQKKSVQWVQGGKKARPTPCLHLPLAEIPAHFLSHALSPAAPKEK